MMKKIKNIFLALTAVILLSSCINVPGGIAPSTAPTDGKTYTKLGPTVSGSDSVFYLFNFIPITSSNSMRTAIANAQATGGGDALINVTVEGTCYWYIILLQYKTTVQGDPIRFDR